MSIGLLLKKCFSRIFFPVPLTFIIILIGLFLLIFVKKRRKTGMWLTGIGAALFIGLSIFGELPLRPLVNRYDRLDPAALDRSEDYAICVAGSNFTETSDGRGSFGEHSTLRMDEAARIAEYCENHGINYVLVTSVADPMADPAAKTAAMNEFYRPFGIPESKQKLVHGAENSREEVKEFAKYDGDKIIVSSAWHVPRLMMLAEKYDLDALPAPAPYIGGNDYTIMSWIPSGKHLENADNAVYEYLGMLEYLIF